MGAKLGLKLALGYAAFISVLLGIVALNPLVLLSAAFYALFIGLIPAILTGTIAGVLFYVLFDWLGDDLSEWKITAVGWAVGIPFALILFALIAWGTLGINATYLEFIEAVKGLSFLLLCPAAITVFAIGWLARQIGGLA